LGESWVPVSHIVAGDEAYLHVKFHNTPTSQTDRTDNCPIA